MDIFNGVLQYLLKINDKKQIERDCHSKVRITLLYKIVNL